MRIAVREVTAYGSDISDAHIRERLHCLHNSRQMPLHESRVLNLGERCHRANAKIGTVLSQAHTDKGPANSAQTYQTDRLEDLRLHHQHQRTSSAHWANCRIPMI